MSRWSKWLLCASMVGWTAMTVLAGWYAFRGSATASADVGVPVTFDAAAPGAVRETRALTPDEVRTLRSGQQLSAPSAPPTVAATTPAGTGRQAVPKYSGAVGVDRRIRPANTDARRPAPPAVAGRKGIVVLDPGHGRGDPGAVHYWPDGHYYTEAESNLRNAELIRDDLVAMGYDVYLTRDGQGQGPDGPLPLQFITSDLYARVALAKAVDADVYLAIHGNGASVKSISGPETWYCGKHAEGTANEDLARRVQSAMMEALATYGYAAPDRGIKEDAASHHSGDFCQFVVTRETPVPAALLEFLFLSNDADANVLADDRAHVSMAHSVAIALDEFMASRR